MKHFTKLFFLLLAPAAAIAQPTITQADFPSVGSSWITVGDTTTVLPISSAGPSQNWNYAAQLSNPTDTSFATFISPSATPPAYQQSYPNANLAIYEPADSVAVFYRKSSTGMFLDGLYIAANTGLGVNAFDFNPDQMLIPAPFTYNNTRSHVAKLKLNVSQMGSNFQVVQYAFQSFVADAHGSLTTPTGTFANTLRIKNTTYYQDTVYAVLGTFLVPVQSNGPHDTTSTYMWMQNGANSMLLQIQEDPANPGFSTAGGGAYYNFVTLGAPAAVAAAQVQPYPNPASSLIRFPIEAEGAESLVIYDALGRPVATENVRGIGLLAYGTSHLTAGMYSYTIQGKAGAELQKGRFTIIR